MVAPKEPAEASDRGSPAGRLPRRAEAIARLQVLQHPATDGVSEEVQDDRTKLAEELSQLELRALRESRWSEIPRWERGRGDFRPLWHSDYYDGPLSGMVESREGRRFWYEAVRDEGDSVPRAYFAYDLRPEQLAEEEAVHTAFREHVGTHTDYDSEGRRDLARVKPQEQWAAFYEVFGWRRRPSYSERPIVAWFEW